MADRSVSLEVHGLKEFQASLRRVDGNVDKEVRKALKKIAMGVVRRARSKMDHPGGNAAMSIRPGASDRGAGISAGGTKAPYFPWLDFGGSVGRGHSPGDYWSGSIRREWRGVPVGSGRYIYPAIAESKDEIGEGVTDIILDAAKRAGLDVVV